jgi:hypothetical protein
MYVDILSSALDEWVSDLRGPMLVQYAVVCRAEMLAVTSRKERSAYSALAAEIAYDRALITLCTERGIDAHATSFAYPAAERQRIESLLVRAGLDIVALSSRRSIGVGETPAEESIAPLSGDCLSGDC